MLLEPVFSFIENNRERFVRELAQFLSIPSVSTLSEHEKDVLGRCRLGARPVKKMRIQRKNLSYRAPSGSSCPFA